MGKRTIEEEIRVKLNVGASTQTSGLEAAVKNIETAMKSLGGSGTGFGKLKNQVSDLTEAMGKYKNIMSQKDANAKDLQEASRLYGEIENRIAAIGKTIGNIQLDPNKLMPKEALTRVETLAAEIAEMRDLMKGSDSSAIQAATQAYKDQKLEVEALTNKKAELERQQKSLGASINGLTNTKSIYSQLKNDIDKVVKSNERLNNLYKNSTSDDLTKRLKEITEEYAKQDKVIESLSIREKKAQIDVDAITNKDTEKYRQASAQVQKIGVDKTAAQNKQQELKEEEEIIKNIIKLREQEQVINSKKIQLGAIGAELEKLKGASEAADAKLTELSDELETLKMKGADTATIQRLREEFANLAGIDLNEVPADMEELSKALNTLQEDKLNRTRASLDGVKNAVDETGTVAEQSRAQLQDYINELNRLTDTQQQIRNLTTSVLQFFSLTNGWQLLKRGVKEAYNSIKELDDAMTEIAVVSDFTVDQLWNMRQEYTQTARQVGMTTLDVVKAQTLYIQQGLDFEEATEASVETLKMAKIANIDAADATELMTAALRGYNMEMSEATRVNDVYSELAANTAANTNQIATAMSKTASIAYNAGASFENMSAFLSQIIETTQEAPETAGTAMKTIIARFQELKKSPLEIGEVDGEMVNANAIEAALAEAGVALRNTTGEFRNFDEVILELAGKWDTIDTMTQRYIATMAAGSRQQSRFLALMSDNERLVELTEMAAESSGSAQIQFEKTLDSLDAKVTRLKDAWQSYLRTLADNRALKWAVDALTGILNLINDITGDLPPMIGSFVTLAMSFGGFKLAGGVLTKVFTKLGAAMYKGGVEAGAQGATGVKTGFASSLNGIEKGVTAFIGKIKKVFSKDTWVGLGTNATLYKKQQQNLAQLSSTYNKLQTSISQTDKLANRSNITEKTRATYLARSNRLQQEAANVSFQKLGVEKAISQTLAHENSQLALNATQQAAVNALEQQGVSTETAELIVRKGLQKSTTDQIIAQSIAAGATKEEIEERLKLAATMLGEKKARDTLENQQKMGLLTQAKELIALLFAGKARREEALATLQAAGALVTKTGADGKATTSQWALNAAIYACPLGWILLIILAVIAALAVLTIAIYRSSDAFKMKQAKENLEKAQSAVEELKEEIQETKENLDDFKEGSATLNELQKGTSAWTDALLKANEAALELLDKYEVLYEYVQYNADGSISFKEGYEEAILSEQQKKAAARSAVAASARIDLIEATSNTDRNENANEAMVNITSGTYDNTTGADTRVTTPTAITGEELEAASRYYAENRWRMADPNFSKTDLIQEALANTNKSKFGNGVQVDFNEDYMAKLMEETNQIATKKDQQITAQRFSSISGIINTLDSDYASSDFSASINNLLSETGIIDTIYADAQSMDKYEAVEGANKKLGLEVSGKKRDGRVLNQYLNTEENQSGQNNRKAMQDEAQSIVASYNVAELATELNNAAIEDGELGALLNKDYSQIWSTDQSGLLEIPTTVTTDTEEIDQAMTQIYNNWDDLSDYAKQALRDSYVDAQKEIISIGADLRENIFGSDTEAQNFIQNMGFTDAINTMEAYNALAGANQQAFAETVKSFTEGDEAEMSGFLEFFEGNPFGSAIQGAATLDEMLKSGNKYAAKMAFLMDKTAFSTGAQVNELYKLMSSEQKEALKENGMYDSTKILEAAKSNTQLNQVLEQTGVSVSALANYYQDLDDGILSAGNASNNFIKILSDMNEVANSVKDALSFLETFDPGQSSTEVGTGFAELIQQVQELYNMGAYGDTKIQNILGELLGNNWDEIKKQAGDMKEAIEIAMSSLKIPEEGQNLYALWADVVQKDQNGVFTIDENGMIQINLGVAGINNQADIEQYLQDIGGYSATTANAMMADLITYSPDAGAALNAQNINEATTDWIGQKIKEQGIEAGKWNYTEQEDGSHAWSNKVLAIDEKEMKKMAEQAGMSAEEYKKKIEKELKDQGYNVTIEYTTYLDGKEMNENAWDVIAQDGLINEDDLNFLMSLGLDETEAKQALEDFIVDGVKSGDKAFTDIKFGFNNDSLNNTLNENRQKIQDGTEEGTSLGLVEGYQSEMVAAQKELDFLNTQEGMTTATAVGLVIGFNQAVPALLTNLGDAMGLLGGGFKAAATEYTKKHGDGTADIEQIASTVSTAFEARRGAAQDAYDIAKANYESSLATMGVVDGDGKVKGYDENGRRTGTTGSGGSDSDTWEEDYDWLYNMIQKLNKLMRDREKLEWDYDQLLRKRTTTENDLLSNMYAQRDNLKEQLALSKEKEKLRKDELEALKSEFADVSAYVWWDDELGIQINEEKMRQDEASISSEYGERIDEAVSEFERMWDEQEESMSEIQDAIDGMEELIEEGMDEYKDLEERLIDAIVEMRQEQIDELEKINESINDTNTAILDKLQEEIDEYRQDRDNEEELTDIQEAERRLALMQTDTSGANALEIMKAEEELRDMRQDYLDNQIDQALDNLSKDNEEAYEQRQKQIELMQEQLEADQETGVIAKEANDWLTQVAQGNGGALTKLKELLAGTDGVLGMAAASKDEWERSLTESVAKAIFGWTEDNKTSALMDEGIIKQGQTIEFTDKMGNTLSGVLQENGKILANGNYYDDIFRGADGKYTQMTTGDITAKPVDPPEPPKEEQTTSTQAAAPTIGIGSRINASGAKISSYAGGPGYNQYYGSDPIYNVIGESGNYWMVRHHALSRGVTGWFKKSDVTAYQTGGLADFTGPAWLDGTKARPEYVLNAEQTKGFLSLVGILDNFDANGKKSNGDNYYDIHIEVDEIGDDYDVEQLMEKMKDMIVEDASYRNVNAVDLGRR